MSDVRASLLKVLGDNGDEMLMDYIVGVLQDEHFEWGTNGEGAFEAIGEFLVTHISINIPNSNFTQSGGRTVCRK